MYFRLIKALDPAWRIATQMSDTKESFSNALTGPALTKTSCAVTMDISAEAARMKRWKFASNSAKSGVNQSGFLDTVTVMCTLQKQTLSSRAPPRLEN